MPCSPPENLDQEFDFYIRFVKPLVLNLPEANDRVKAAAWIQKLRSVTDDLNLRNEYLKLFLFALQRRRIVGPFADVPSDTLEPFPEGYGLTDMMKCLIELDAKEEKSGIHPPCTTEISSDLKEYAAVQKIPNYGVHCYLAISNEPLPKWERGDQVVLPPGVIRPKDSTPDVSNLKTGVPWVDNLRKSPCKKVKSEAPCGTCKPPEPCKTVSFTTPERKPCPGAGKKSARKKRFTDDELSGLGEQDPEALDMADALLCSPSLVKRELFLDDHDIFDKGRGRGDNTYLQTILEPSPGEKAVEVGDEEDDDDEEGQSEFGYAGEEDEDADESEGGEEEQGEDPMYSNVVEVRSGYAPVSSGVFDTPLSEERPPYIHQRLVFLGQPQEPFNQTYDTPFRVHPDSWMYPDAPHYRGDDREIPVEELAFHVWQDQDEIGWFPWNIGFVPDRPIEFHIQRRPLAHQRDHFDRFRLVPPRLADVPNEDRPETMRFFHIYKEVTPSQYEELIRQQQGLGGRGGEEYEGEEEESEYFDAYP